ncbi:MAG: hypothetical protein V4663_08050 [Bacteroidota bacterium]
MIFDKIYRSLPIWLQNFAVSIYGYGWNKRRFGGVFTMQKNLFQEREFFTGTEWIDYQRKTLRSLLKHSLEEVEFYKNKYASLNVSPIEWDLFELEDLKKLPFLEKDDFRKYGETTLLAKHFDKDGTFLSSSGSSGTPTRIYFSKKFHQTWQAALEVRMRQWAGVTFETPRGMIGGRRIVPDANAKGPYYRYNWFEKQTYFSAYHISKANVKDYLEGMIRNNVQYMTGYAFANYELALLIESSGLVAPKMKAVITSSEKLTIEMRDVLSRVYQCKVYDSYSGNEACGLITESPENKLLFSPDTGIIEILDDLGNEVQPGEEGELVFTGLLNFDQPLIRYRIGDRAIKAKNQLTLSARHMQVVDEIAGRIEDKIVTRDGRVMVRFHSLFYDLPNLQKGQVIQQDYESYIINLQIEEEYDKKSSEEIITKRLNSQIDNDLHIEFNYFDKIPVGPNAKFRAVISKMNKK